MYTLCVTYKGKTRFMLGLGRAEYRKRSRIQDPTQPYSQTNPTQLNQLESNQLLWIFSHCSLVRRLSASLHGQGVDTLNVARFN